MLDLGHINYFKAGEIENKKFWKRLEFKPDFKGKTVLDFGCGLGSLAIEIAKMGAKKVVAIDLEDEFINFAQENLDKNYPNLTQIVRFEKVDLLKTNEFKEFDFIITKDTFEHTLNLDKVLKKFYEVLKFDGKVLIGFGPLYNFYNGDHGRTKAILPWFHLIIPERVLINRINKKNAKKIEKIEDLGLSKYSFKEYLNFFKNSEFDIVYFNKNLSDHPISFIFNFFSKFKIFEEYCTYNIYCILEK